MTETTLWGIVLFKYSYGDIRVEPTQTAFWTVEDANQGAIKMAESFAQGRDRVERLVTPPGLPTVVEVKGCPHTRRYTVKKLIVRGSPLTALAGQAE